MAAPQDSVSNPRKRQFDSAACHSSGGCETEHENHRHTLGGVIGRLPEGPDGFDTGNGEEFLAVHALGEEGLGESRLELECFLRLGPRRQESGCGKSGGSKRRKVSGSV
jgi:hypothetical protein